MQEKTMQITKKISSKSFATTISKELQNNRKNEFLHFLIVLDDKHYKPGIFQKSYADMIHDYEFPGELKIVNKNDLSNHENAMQYIIDGPVILKKIYVQLPKEKLYVPIEKYDEKLLNSINNEFLRIIATLQPNTIKMRMLNCTKSEFQLNMNGGINTPNINTEQGFSNEQIQENDKHNYWELSFQQNNMHIDVNHFLNTNDFYYLPKKNEWNNCIRNRMQYGMKEDNYIYEYNYLELIDRSFLSNIKFLKFDAEYIKRKSGKIKFEYKIEYYPLNCWTIPCTI